MDNKKECIKEFIKTNDFKKMCGNIYNKSSIKYSIEFDEFISECTIFILKYFYNFNSEKGKLTSFIYRMCVSCKNMYLRDKVYGQSKKTNKLDFRNNVKSLDFQYDYENNNEVQEFFCEDINSDFTFSLEIKEFLQKLKEYKEICYNVVVNRAFGYKSKEIAKKYGLSQSREYQLYHEGINYLKNLGLSI